MKRSLLEIISSILVLSGQNPPGPAGGAPDGYAGARSCWAAGGATLAARDRAMPHRPHEATPSR